METLTKTEKNVFYVVSRSFQNHEGAATYDYELH